MANLLDEWDVATGNEEGLSGLLERDERYSVRYKQGRQTVNRALIFRTALVSDEPRLRAYTFRDDQYPVILFLDELLHVKRER